MKKTNKKSQLILEVNKKYFGGDENNVKLGNTLFVITPPIDEEYWQFRVMVDKEQAIVGFPKFNTLGIGFAKEDDWNTNLPYNSSTNEIWEHIKRNKYFASISDKDCIKAIKMVQNATKEYFKLLREVDELLIFNNEPHLKSQSTGKMMSKKEFKDSCQILRARKTTEFTSSFFGQTREIKMRKFCLLFGYLKDQSSYRYKFTTYETTTDKAVERFMYVLREQNLHLDFNKKNYETLQVGTFENGQERGFKIPICF
ncbi:MAG: hypothetical protein WCP52_02150 [Bacteroidota bacterium]